MADPTPAAGGPGTTFFELPDFTLARAARTATRLVETYRGPWTDVEKWANALEIGDAHADTANYKYFSLQAVDLVRDAGPSGTATLTYTNAGVDDTASEGQQGKARVIETSWRLSTSPIDVSVYRYCGQSQGANANRARIESWWNRVHAGEYVAEDGTIEIPSWFNAGDRAIAEKLVAGKEVVQRHYPTVVKTTLAGSGALAPAGKLDHIAETNGDFLSDCPPWMSGRAKKWLKVQEDSEYNADGSQTLVESWIGGDNFDENFYGNADQSGLVGRWEFGTI
ncbi:MAG: hypothetical protein IJ678_00970 [Kiritimatiellae bacterium]|nr:hypothetical protein [Kiritimatiellia bacterium]